MMKAKVVLVGLVLSFLLLVSPTLAKGQPSPFPTPKRALNEVRLRACQARESAIQTRMRSLVRLTENIESKFNAIALRVESFYAGSGKTISNYQGLVDDISAKKAIVDLDLQNSQGIMNSFGCTGEDPNGLLNHFRLDMQKVKTDLKNYRTSIKNLIVAVRPLAPEATEKPEETETPEATPTATP